MKKNVKIIISFLFKLINRHISEEKVDIFVEFICFCCVGVTNTIVGYIANISTLFLLSNYEYDYVIANIVCFIVGTLWAFFWNNRFVFDIKEGKTRSWIKALLKTFALYAFSGIILSNLLSYLWIDVLGISKVVAPLINAMINVPVNYILSKVWAFRSVSA